MTLTQIKKTKSVEMYFDENGKGIVLFVHGDHGPSDVYIPLSKAFQVKRGLESAVQRVLPQEEEASMIQLL